MSTFGWVPGWDKTSFQPAPGGGWLFSTPSVWPRRTYLVTDEQKERLAGPIRRLMWIQMAVTAGVCAILLTAQAGSDSTTRWLTLCVAAVALTLLSSVHTAVALRPYLDGLTRTQSRVGFADRFKRQVAIMPAAVVIVLALVSFALFAMSAYMALGAKWDWTLIAGTAIFGSMTLYSVAILVAKQRANR